MRLEIATETRSPQKACNPLQSHCILRDRMPIEQQSIGSRCLSVPIQEPRFFEDSCFPSSETSRYVPTAVQSDCDIRLTRVPGATLSQPNRPMVFRCARFLFRWSSHRHLSLPHPLLNLHCAMHMPGFCRTSECLAHSLCVAFSTYRLIKRTAF